MLCNWRYFVTHKVPLLSQMRHTFSDSCDKRKNRFLWNKRHVLPETPAWFSQCRSGVTNCRFLNWYWSHTHLPSRPLQTTTVHFKIRPGNMKSIPPHLHYNEQCAALTAQWVAACSKLWVMNWASMHRHGSSFTSEFIRATRAASRRASAWLSHTCRENAPLLTGLFSCCLRDARADSNTHP